ncbi:MAG: hypothetical protein IEMM0008_1930 [bacterium]|nr:MAG: hypothetical protein IEMM0008_1930 [bacterium]
MTGSAKTVIKRLFFLEEAMVRSIETHGDQYLICRFTWITLLIRISWQKRYGRY